LSAIVEQKEGCASATCKPCAISPTWPRRAVRCGAVRICMGAEPDPEFVDTNVLVYAHDRSAGVKHDRAVALMERLWQARTGCLSLQGLTEFYV
jgi:hypothetical protein